MPERFLHTPEGLGEEFPTNVVFGWGRRYVLEEAFCLPT